MVRVPWPIVLRHTLVPHFLGSPDYIVVIVAVPLMVVLIILATWQGAARGRPE